ncbi:hypothetical protein [Kibdelosporangium philippinense]|uniref:hypothetical protein n=1 Tax=Kibdelosporangium philippinense TaxID=211113 RepID=UPI0036076C95
MGKAAELRGPHRTDITYTPQPGNRFVAEIKRRSSKATRIAVERDHLPQATNYTATGPPFGILIVGDHGPHTAGYTSLDDSVWITPVTPVTRSPTETPRLMVIGVLRSGVQLPATSPRRQVTASMTAHQGERLGRRNPAEDDQGTHMCRPASRTPPTSTVNGLSVFFTGHGHSTRRSPTRPAYLPERWRYGFIRLM